VSLRPLTTKKVDVIVEYLREYEAICKKASSRGSGDQMEMFDEKKPEAENLMTGSLYQIIIDIFYSIDVLSTLLHSLCFNSEIEYFFIPVFFVVFLFTLIFFIVIFA
jgi:hypothetical protein